MKVIVSRCSDPDMWYYDTIPCAYSVVDDPYSTEYYLEVESENRIHKCDCDPLIDDNSTICGNCGEKYEKVREDDTTGLCGICDIVRQSEEHPIDCNCDVTCDCLECKESQAQEVADRKYHETVDREMERM